MISWEKKGKEYQRKKEKKMADDSPYNNEACKCNTFTNRIRFMIVKGGFPIDLH